MNTDSTSNYNYQFGGSLPSEAQTYVTRQADRELYEHLKLDKFCYILTSRQMGKSSLRVRTMQRLQKEGIVCGAIDLTAIGTENITPEQWYGGIINSLENSFQLYQTFDLNIWWQKQSLLSSVQRFSQFIEEVLLPSTSNKIVIFVDEIDSTLSLPFNVDDFFAVIRNCYNCRADRLDYRRLTFVLIGVATPSDLIQDKRRTSFNIGNSIEMKGFQLEEAQPLISGLAVKNNNSQAILKTILDWTNGQPFLTQKLCHLISKANNLIPEGKETEWIGDFVRSQIIDNWEIKDTPEHLKHIRDRILQSSRTGRLLGLYQQILQQGEILADGSPEQMELSLSGLVVKQEGKLKVFNRIYEEIFTNGWLDKVLANLRPYAQAITAWIASECQDESRLLRGQALQEALTWAASKSLSDRDYQFITTSQEFDKKEAEKALQAERQARQIEKLEADIVIEQAEKQKLEAEKETTLVKLDREKKLRKATQVRNRIVFSFLALVSGLAIWILWQNNNIDLTKLSYSVEILASQQKKFEALMQGLKTGNKLQSSFLLTDTATRNRVVATMQQALLEVREKNRLQGHNYAVNSISFSPDGTKIVSASDDCTIKLWKENGKLISTKPSEPCKSSDKQKKSIKSLTFSPDGKTIITGDDKGYINIWNSSNLSPIKTFQALNGKPINSVKFSPNGQAIASASDDGTIKLWNLSSQLIKNFSTTSEPKTSVNSISFCSNGKIIAAADRDGKVKLWKIDDKENLPTILPHSQSQPPLEVTAVDCSPTEDKVISASQDGTLKIWSIEGTLLKTVKAHSDRINRLKFSPDGQTIASASDDHTIKLWNLDGDWLQTLPGHNDRVTSLSFHPTKKGILISGSFDNTIIVWNLNGEASSNISGSIVSFSPDGQTIATATTAKVDPDPRSQPESVVQLWNFQAKPQKQLKLPEDSQEFTSISFSPDRKTIATGRLDGTVNLWNSDGSFRKTLVGHDNLGDNDRGVNPTIVSISFSPDGKTIATASHDHTVKLWSLDGTLLNTLTKHTDEVTSVNFSPKENLLASASKDNTIKLWTRDGKFLQSIPAHADRVNSISFSPDGKFLASASNDSTVKLWKVTNHNLTLLREMKGHSGWVNSVSISPDSQLIASAGDDRTVRLWNFDGILIKTLRGHRAEVLGISFSPDSKLLASADENKSVILWSLDLDRLLNRTCNWVNDYLVTNHSDRDLCPSIR
jgi:WD40 repeat protein